jgi:ABC-type branched-subunit amino acid transport system ATPase component
VSELCEKVYVLAAGKVIAEGTPAEIQMHEEVISSYLGRARTVVE